MTPKKLCAPSIVLEWETVEEGGTDRATRGLREVHRQVAQLEQELQAHAELIVCYEECVTAGDDLQSLLDRAAGASGWPCRVILLDVPTGTSYYEKKNIGARASTNDVIVFLDSDLIPDPDWLGNLLAPFQDWSVSIMIGATHLDHATHYGMAVALTWIFDPATYGRGIQPLRRHSSNNLAIRRNLFLKFLFPTHPTFRGQCSQLGQNLLAAGIVIREHTDARTSHPPPPGFLGFIHRAWAAGTDEHYYASINGAPTPSWAVRQLLHDYKVVTRRIRERRPLLKPTVVAESLGWILGWSYYGIKASGYLSKTLKSSRHVLVNMPQAGS